ncbi:glycosyltransferase [Bacillus sp. CBEL-1]|nr:glycosyltransferase [Bacillus sp. CBEL-1]
MQAKLTIVGSLNSYSEELIVLSKSLALEEHIIFKGFLSGQDLDHIYINADITIVPSHCEPFGLVAAEACQYGLPTIACDGVGYEK